MDACNEALKGVYPAKKEVSLLKRVERVHTDVVRPYIHDGDGDPRKIGIIAFYLLQHLIDTETLIIPEDCSLAQALEHMLPALSPWEGSTDQEIADFEQIDRSARKQVRKMLQHLQTEGYYKDIPLPHYH
jgi:hypothetical protein